MGRLLILFIARALFRSEHEWEGASRSSSDTPSVGDITRPALDTVLPTTRLVLDHHQHLEVPWMESWSCIIYVSIKMVFHVDYGSIFIFVLCVMWWLLSSPYGVLSIWRCLWSMDFRWNLTRLHSFNPERGDKQLVYHFKHCASSGKQLWICVYFGV